ncbi:MAG: InlB B-repeat-containing protein [Bryobacteraceae bacterium]
MINGSGSGTYATGTVVTIAANPPPNGQTFLDWSGAAVQNADASTIALTMPAANTTVTATYSSSPAYTLTVVNGTGSGQYTAGTVVNISANPPPAGEVFAGWTGAAVQSGF